MSDLLFCPTENTIQNLLKEAIGNSPYGETVIYVGDIMYDAVLYYANKAEQKSSILSDLELVPGNFILSTVHRAENTDDPVRLKNIIGVSLMRLPKNVA